MIEAYLRELDARLAVPRRLRGRILDETRDHLLELVDGGLSEHEAVQAFGAPEALAREFHEQLAGTSAHRSSALTGLMLVVLAVAYAFAPGAWGSGPVVLIAGQIAVVAGVLALVRSLRFRSAHAVPPSRLADIYRANALALGCVALIAIYVAVTGPVMPAAVLGAIALASALALARSVARARPVAGGEPEDDAFDDLLALAQHAPAIGSQVARHADRLELLRRHPWRFCAAFAATCGLAAGVGHAITDGGLTALTAGHIARAVAATLVIAAIEGAAVVLAFVAFGRLLGIRRA